MGVCFLYGNGGSSGDIKLTVFNGTTAPANPQDNYVWIKTTASLDDLLVCGKTWSPSNRAGRIWLQYEDVASTSYQWLLKKAANVFVSIPLCGCAIANGTTWTKLDAYLYYSGEWHQFSSTQYTIFNAGGATDYSGGWNAYAYKSQSSGSTPKAPTFTLGSTMDISLYGQYEYSMGTVFSEAAIDLTKYSTLVIEIASTQTGVTSSGEYGGFSCGLCASKQNNWTPAATATNVSAGTHTIDISALSGSYYLSLSLGGVAQGLTGKASITRIYLK